MYEINLFFLIFFLSIFGLSAQPRCCDNNYKAGKKAFDAQNYDEAIRFYTQGSKCGDNCKYDFAYLIKEVKTKQILHSKSGAKAATGKAVQILGADYMVVAGSWSNKDNAEDQVRKLKALGFQRAEAVKLENSASTYVIAGYYAFKGGADAAVRTLKANKIESYAKKTAGKVYIPSAVPDKPAAKPE